MWEKYIVNSHVTVKEAIEKMEQEMIKAVVYFPMVICVAFFCGAVNCRQISKRQ